ncbi:hypothetical protein L2745_18435 [Shewanella xiamenensis]|uniref:hypothetical protein n=1 Tax=Shewanella xiamenensis TaxID=332186 RepID=UPI00166C0013|nr:hypothetical protein [Shewanella xiamenensis]MCL1072592.1 hypothetical protein [Shewanella xiamenensis]GGN02647.1 hypothetical protein GCM10009124_35530 [Shewanella xiamenensis]
MSSVLDFWEADIELDMGSNCKFWFRFCLIDLADTYGCISQISADIFSLSILKNPLLEPEVIEHAVYIDLDRSSTKEEFEIVVQANTSTKLVESNYKTSI